ncbi:hypothetical protein DO97_03575 [Neosynechococcus sphagnicola sy1]|uniref:Uncharacterized protein n=1 Tax=Neosynechococcus sphagnicola sy1 TaxID=1497020 RepID=A0A098TKL3_9CYAN|nr:hypothetical protein [Neosynechococcus sphagnicola]KGF72829.1 hypothetical protein DO97_03575 [Neosynechococcus sphagnicola sy1]
MPEPRALEAARSSLAQQQIPLLQTQEVKRCHIYLPETPRPMGAVFYRGQFYSYVRFFPSVEGMERAALRLRERSHTVLVTSSTKGFVLWAMEPEARLARRSAKA